ncbi:hypothetical protein BOW16_12930 [Solemya velum gill symbiont]|nr:hypothetical protein [Solemya velum gill symbiont]OOY49369.1 hypothetical protein BOV97_12860 [Solemya velum gill symbiont]OOY72274.1 hypothetical protein BOW09_12225 [Solemya velum gill symbiont]OOY77008.1 hypothetical protein BOW11_13025 [Solemya velum gill symbiont]OOY88657.1 hypothetical protein BOW16_12930 [Solemya velum gill symbiont]OOZ01258.1 hypothetical protein BOW21_11575 [Solemya velum gill symbiont]
MKMSETLLEKHEPLVIEIGEQYLDNMEVELGKKYKNTEHHVNAGLSDDQSTDLRYKYDLTINEFSEIYSSFIKMKPGQHLQQVLNAFVASGGNVDIEPAYDEESQRLNVTVQYVIKDNTLDNIEGLSAMENLVMRMNAMIQIENVLSGSNPDGTPDF